MSTITSKNTSVNIKKLPAIYKKVNWRKVQDDFLKKYPHLKTFAVLDYGCGKKTDHIMEYLKTQIDSKRFAYIPYDPYWSTEEEKKIACGPMLANVGAWVCSNVFNVIKDDYEVNFIHDNFILNEKLTKTPYFITIYEGNKSGVGKETKPDCWQRNEPIKQYLKESEVMYKNIILKPEYKQYIR